MTLTKIFAWLFFVTMLIFGILYVRSCHELVEFYDETFEERDLTDAERGQLTKRWLVDVGKLLLPGLFCGFLWLGLRGTYLDKRKREQEAQSTEDFFKKKYSSRA